MMFRNFVVLCAGLLLCENALCEVSELSVAPNVNEQSAVETTKTPEIPLTPLSELEFRDADGVERAFDKTGEPFSGAIQKKNDEGLMITYFYRNGYKNGVAVAYGEDGHLELETTYRKGHKDGEEISFFENGKPRLKQTFSQDVLNGEEVIFYNNGKAERVNNYVDGKLDGQTTYFDREGNITKKETYKNGKKNGLEHIISDKMLQEENHYVDDVLDGITKKFNQEYLTEEISYKDGKKNGLSKRYLENGSWSELEYKNDALNGVSKSFYPDKTLAETVNYINNQRNGLAEKFNQKGLKTSSENYKNGQLEGISRKFNDNGELASVTYYVNGIEMAIINIDENTDLRDIYALYNNKNLNKIIGNKNLWYPILWLGINLEKTDILNALENEMKMFASDLGDFSVYKRESKAKFDDYNRKLFFGLTPLSYAVNISAPTEILQKFTIEPDNINMKNPRGTNPLIEAVRLNNLQMVKYLLAHQADVTEKYDGANTILLYALKENAQNEIISELLKAGADANAKDANGQTPLMLAISSNKDVAVDVLLQNNADIKQKTPTGKTLLSYAFENNVNPDIFSKLIVGGANINDVNADGNVLLIQALSAGKYEIAEQLLKNDADVNVENQNGENALSYALSHDIPADLLAKIVNASKTPLKNLPKFDKPLWKVLAEQNRYELLSDAIKNMEKINEKDETGESVFSYLLKNSDNPQIYELITSLLTKKEITENPDLIFDAVDAQNPEILKKMVELGADVNAKNAENKSVLGYILDKKYPLEYVEAIENGLLDINGERALETAIFRDDVALAENLIKNGANVNLLTADSDSTTAGESYLMLLKYNQDKMTELLLANGAEINYASRPDQILLMVAVKNGNETLIKHLLEKGFSVNQSDADGNTSIMYVADMITQYADMPTEELNALLQKIIPLLQAKGADINVQNNNGETLLIKIAKTKQPVFAAVLSTLIDLGANTGKKDQYGKTAADYAR